MPLEYGISYIKENCIQCYGCEVACKTWRNVELGINWRRVENIWKGQYPQVKSISASVGCMHCVDPVCVEACPEGAISKRIEDGIVLVDRDKCVGCQTCLDVCPFGVPQFGDDGIMQKCDMCVNEIDYKTESPPCVESCSTKALVFGQMTRQEKMSMEASIRQVIEFPQSLPKAQTG